MKLSYHLAILSCALIGSFATVQAGPKVLLKTNQGDIILELNEEKAPETVKNFLSYVNDGYYNGTVFHRVIEGFMIQGGGFAIQENGTAVKKETKAPIQNEAANGLKNTRGSIAMARTGDPHSATAQFFINHKDNTSLDHPSFDGWGYAVFGEVISGIEVVDKIAVAATGPQEPMGTDVPKNPIIIESATLVTE